jgi:hypothetical protein
MSSALIVSALTIPTSLAKTKKRQVTVFKVRIDNISSPDGQKASNGTKWSFAISPGISIVHNSVNPIFTPGRDASKALQPQAEDGNPEKLVQTVPRMDGALSTQVFNTPVGANAPRPVTPGSAYEYTLTAAKGNEMSLVFMFGQSNDLFYGNAKPIRLFDDSGAPISGDITAMFSLWDAGTEVNQEPGIGADQAPRQKVPNTGAPEHVAVGPVKDGFTYPKTADVLRITITPEM